MNQHYKKYSRKDDYNNNKHYNNKKNYYYKKNHYNNNYTAYNRRKKISTYDTYEEEASYEREISFSNKAPSTKDGSFSQSTNSNSRKHSYCEYNNDKIENNNSSLIILENNKIEKSGTTHFQKINLSENELKNAYFKPKNYKENSLEKTEIEDKDKDNNENIVILEISVKISNDKRIDFKLRKFDDMFNIIKQTCIENEISQELVDFFGHTIMKALNSIYGIYNLNLKEEEIKLLMKIKQKYENNKFH